MGKSTVFANSQGVSNTSSEAVVVSGPDVCLTPMGSSLVPVPYTNVAKSSSLSGGTKTVKVNGCMGAIDGCCYSTSTGDLPGIGTGVASGTVGSKAEFINYSFDVKIEGKGVCRNSDPMTQNNKNAHGVNQDAVCSPIAKPLDGEQPPLTTFHFKVVEYLSWDVYDEKKKCFFPGEAINKPIATRDLTIKEMSGSESDITTDENGEFELKNQETTAKFEITMVPESAELNNKYHLYYNKCAPVQKKL